MSLRTLAYISGVYDLALALPMLFIPLTMAQLFGAAPPSPVVNAQLNGVFTLSLAVGYFWAAQAPEERRGYFWVAGVLAKGLGAALIVADHFLQSSPTTFLLFAATDGVLALVTSVLLRARKTSDAL